MYLHLVLENGNTQKSLVTLMVESKFIIVIILGVFPVLFFSARWT